ncbi:MAG TPA: hypothetical protein PKD09_09525 [Aggregatilinea sp.]|uniref:hypothetical protein n=1 Tax=Aggregatilinea sp. TaxID=2806333 RepID=UPI002C1C8B13|nr:hypothetical protein [Aggregatilinea sp.]HML21877.1 hypothetical protein [Aggregatilinea sp.]
MTDITNIGVPQVANQAFVPLAIEAGIEQVIRSLVPLATDKQTLLISLKTALSGSNPGLAAALNMDTLDAVLKYITALPGSPIVLAAALPEMLNADGPASVAAARDSNVTTQVNISFPSAPEGYGYGIYLDGLFRKQGNQAGTSGWVSESISDVPVDGQEHTIRVLYIKLDGGALTRFGPVARFT